MSDIEEKAEKYFDEGLEYFTKGNLDNAIECFENIPVGDKDYYTAQYNIGLAYGEKGEFDKAIE